MPPFTYDFAAFLHEHAARLVTRRLVLADGVAQAPAAHLLDLLPTGRWLLVADPTTQPLAGDAAAADLAAHGVTVQRHLVLPARGGTAPVADHVAVAQLATCLRASGAVAALAVGSGTVNDITKMACNQVGLPYAVIATAPSMNGYTSSIAAILDRGVKTTPAARAPVACLCDPVVLAAAPYRMLASGYGDLLSKPVSNADWLLAHRLLDAPYSPSTLQLIERSNSLLDGIAHRLPARDRDAVARLSASLLLSGLAMTLAGSSAPASGGEHLISHYLDMTHHAWGESMDLHGCQVGVATLTTARLYERLLDLPLAALDVAALVARAPTWAQVEATVQVHFGSLADAVLPQARAAHVESDALYARLSRLRALWPSLHAELRASTRPVATIRADLAAAGCPLTFAALGANRPRTRRAIVDARYVRARYSILHLAAELGVLEAWADELVE